MKYRVTIEGREREVDVVVAPEGGVRASIDGAPIDADVVRVPGGLSLRIGGHVYDVAVGGKADSMQVSAGVARALVEVQSERMRSRARRGGGEGTGEKELRAPMPGRVVKVLIAAGDSVTRGDPCVVVEAMKMENELRAPRAGIVREVRVAEGASVEAQAVLVVID